MAEMEMQVHAQTQKIRITEQSKVMNVSTIIIIRFTMLSNGRHLFALNKFGILHLKVYDNYDKHIHLTCI